MKIAFLGPVYPLRGGIAQFTHLLALELNKKHEVKIFSFRKQYPAFFFPGKEQIDHSEAKPALEIEPIIIPYNPFTWNAAAGKIRKWQPDLLILNYWIPFFALCFGWLIRRLKSPDMRIFYLIHNLEFHENWLLAEKLTRYALSKADRHITLSDAVFDDARKLFPAADIIKAFHPIYNCYDSGRYTRTSARKELRLQDKKVILFFGYIKPYKGLNLLIKAMPLILKKLPDAHLLIVGEVYGNDRIYFDLIENPGLQKQITFVNRFAANEEVELFFKAADVLALPYLSATQSGVAQIAADFGLGFICTPVGGLPELVINGKTGVVAKAVTEESFAEAVGDYFSLDRTEVTKNILAENFKYSWEKFAELLEM